MIIDAAYISDSLNGRRIKEGSYECDCPVAEHRRAKMIVTDADRPEPLIYCHAGCSFIDLKTELDNRGLWPKSNHTPGEKREIRRKIENKAWESAKIWLLIYECTPKNELRDQDRKKYKQLSERFKYKVWAWDVVHSMSKFKTLSIKQQHVLNKARRILE